jgi:hypothetical protein
MTSYQLLQKSDDLHARVQAFIRGRGDESFDALALQIASFQREHVPAVGRLHRALGCDLSRVAGLPAMPCDAFRARRIAVHDESHDKRVFYTSGTTAAQRGVHAFRNTDTYVMAALTWAKQWLLVDAEDLAMWLLAPTEEQAPHSSLSFMLQRFSETLAGPRESFWQEDRLDVEALRQAKSERPVLLVGTSFAFVHACDSLRDNPLQLPPGSRAMQTGGFKGRSRTVQPEVLRSEISRCFGVDERCIVGEYGMTELSSQLYQGAMLQSLGQKQVDDTRSYHPPPWMRVDAVDPVSLESLPRGQEGLGRIVDLANVDSSVAIQTADRVIQLADGSLRLLGRAAGAVPRGCSLSMEHLLT